MIARTTAYMGPKPKTMRTQATGFAALKRFRSSPRMATDAGRKRSATAAMLMAAVDPSRCCA